MILTKVLLDALAEAQTVQNNLCQQNVELLEDVAALREEREHLRRQLAEAQASNSQRDREAAHDHP
jgi:regulator of replication initiation timing